MGKNFMCCLAVVAVCAVAASGCLSSTSAHDPNGASLDREAKLRAELRRSRERVVDLEKQLAAARLEQANDVIGVEDTELPVQVREPAMVASLDQLPRDYEVVGTDDEGVEIVYVGEATNEESFKIPLGRYDLSAKPTPRDRDLEAASDLPVPHDALADGLVAGPTIDNQLRQARSVGPRRVELQPSDEPRDEYQRYYRALRTGNHSFAVTGFRNFVERYPSHEYSDNAQYWLGEAFYDQKQYSEALKEFERVASEHPKGNKVPDALLKVGYSHLALGQERAAQSTFDDLVARFPDSDAARLARQKLGAVRQGGQLANKKD